MQIVPKNWLKFQHYKNRRPPWIKLYRTLLDDVEFHALSDASKALAIMLWLLASERIDAKINADSKALAFRLRTTPEKIRLAIKPLIDGGFFSYVQDASALLASCEQHAIPETETETETETTLSGKPDAPKLNGKLHADAVEILGVLNATAGRNYKSVKANLEIIEARLKEGATSEEIKAVIGRKCSQWGSDEKMSEYLRPATLFNRTKFAQYQGELGSSGRPEWMRDVI